MDEEVRGGGGEVGMRNWCMAPSKPHQHHYLPSISLSSKSAEEKLT